jgi:hypothetical protein
VAITGALSETEQIQAILDEVGDTPDQKVSAWAKRYWDKYAGKAQLDRQLQVLYTTRDCWRLKLSSYQEQNDVVQGPIQYKIGQRTGFGAARITELQAEIERLEIKARKRRVGVTLPITQQTPISVQDELNRAAQPPPQIIDPNDPIYAGSPFEPLPARTTGGMP